MRHGAEVNMISFARNDDALISADGGQPGMDGKLVVTGAADHLVKVWSAKDGKELHAVAGHTSFVHALVCLPDGTCVSGSSELLRWDLATGKRVAEASVRGEVSALAASPDGRLLIVLGPFEKTLQLWSLEGQSLEGPIHSERLDDAPSSATFAGPKVVLVGTKGGRILRFAVE